METITEERTAANVMNGYRQKTSTMIDGAWTSRDIQAMLRVIEAGVSEEDLPAIILNLPEIGLHLTIQEGAERLGISVKSACALVKATLEAREEAG
jgi:hypothetical protein